MNITEHNKIAWDNYVDLKDRWTTPVTKEALLRAKKGDWGILLTNSKAVPHQWFPNLKGLKILGLASGGGQQGPILAALGAEVTIFDNSSKQLFQDEKVSDQFNLNIKTVQGDMKDLSVFPDATFDLIFNPCSILFVENLKQVWSECFRVLKPNGILMSGLINPLSFQIDEENLKLKYKQPYSDISSLSKKELDKLKANKEALIFAHSFTDQIGGQLEAGFVITNIYEDDAGGESTLDKFFPSYMATRAIKL